MRQIVGAFSVLFVLMCNIFIGVGITAVSGEAAAAKEYKANVIAEIENSNFNPAVINSCIAAAQQDGYQLEVTDCVYDVYQQMQTAKVALHYQYRIPLFRVAQEKVTYGIAR